MSVVNNFVKTYINEFDIEKDLEIIINLENGKVLKPIVISCFWETYRKGVAGSLSFEVLKEEVEFTEGNKVSCKYKGTSFFVGYIFKKERDKSGKIKVTAYDQLRYLKNKDTYVFKNVSASDIIKMVANDFNLKIGEIEETGYKFIKRREDNKTLFDMILNAISETLYYTKKNYIFYDDCGKLTLINDKKMRLLDFIVEDKNAANYKYISSINEKTYNQIKLMRVNKDKGTREIFKVNDPQNIKKWGVLQFFENINEKVTDAKAKEKAENLIKLYNHKRRSFTINGIFGDIRVRGGSSFIVNLDVGDIIVNNYMIVEKVKHNFSLDIHTMDIEFIGQMGIKGE